MIGNTNLVLGDMCQLKIYVGTGYIMPTIALRDEYKF